MPEITRIERLTFEYSVEDLGTDPHGFNSVYEPGATRTFQAHGLRIHTDVGAVGEFIGGSSVAHAQIDQITPYLIGKNPFHRERHWNEMKRQLRKYDGTGIGPVDIALWDVAGKHYGAPIHELLGTCRTELPAYASTYFADENGGLDSPEAFANFAEQCSDLGFPGFKMHTWSGTENRDVRREVELVRTVGERVGDEMDLMFDPCCEYETFGQAYKVGKACDEYGYFWYEDPYRDGGRSAHGHRTLRESIETPLLVSEHLRGLESITDLIEGRGTDFVRANPAEDGGVTGAMKIARVAEGFGLDVEFHLPGPVRRHCMAAVRNSNYYELGLVHPDKEASLMPPVYGDGYSDALTSVDESGCVPVPDGPGIGVEYDWSFVESNLVDREVVAR